MPAFEDAMRTATAGGALSGQMRAAARLALRVGGLVVAFVAADRWLLVVAHLGLADYRQWSITEALFAAGNPLLWLGVAAVLAVVLLRPRASLAPWRELPRGRALRGFVMVLAVALAWPFTTYGYNHFLGQAHAADRLLLLALLLLVLWRPVFVWPFLLLAHAIMWQIDVPPLGGPIFAHKLIVLQMLTVFAVWLLARAARAPLQVGDLLFVSVCLMAGRYWEAGYAKLSAGWITYGHIERELYSAYAHGWLAFLPRASVEHLAALIGRLDGVLGWPVLALELGALMILVRRWTPFAILGAAVIFHLGVFVLMGFLFWTWMVVDLALIGLILALRRVPADAAIHRPAHVALSIPLIALAVFWNDPPRLAWFDSTLSYTTRYEVVGESGRHYAVSPRFFAPYGDRMTFSFFAYLSPHAVLAGPYGASSRANAEAADTVTAAPAVFALEAATPPAGAPERAAVFYDFVTTYMTDWNARCCRPAWWQALRPPPQFWSFHREGEAEAYAGQERVREVIVTEVTSWFDGRSMRDIRTLQLKRLPIPMGAG